MFLKCQKSQKNTWNILLCLIFQLLFAVFYYVLVVFLLYSISQKVQWKTFGSLVSQSVTHWQCGPKRYILEQLKKIPNGHGAKYENHIPPLPPSIVVQTCVWPEVCFPDFVACGETVYQIEGAAEQINQFVQRRPPIHPSGAKFNKQTNWASDDVGRVQASTKMEWI